MYKKGAAAAMVGQAGVGCKRSRATEWAYFSGFVSSVILPFFLDEAWWAENGRKG